MRSIPILASLGYPVVFDVTHSVRVYGTPSSDAAGGEPKFIPYLACAAVAAGCDGIFIETHQNPADAKCDACSMLPTSSLQGLLEKLKKIDEVSMRRSDGGQSS
jgi:2-dehydro-3-deoxyphosphooctonate aldolase (KDO 8-P synthase)